MNFTHFFETTDSIAEGLGFSYFDNLHIGWLIVLVLTVVLNCLFYRKMNGKARDRWRKVIAWLLVADELFKIGILTYAGRYTAGYLPFHLCSINIFMILFHVYRPTAVVDNFLYTVCIPGAMAALLFPSWSALPLTSGMHLHSFTVHILLFMYPVVLTINGDIKPDIKQLLKSLGLLVLMAIPIYGINLLLDTNFMFLMSADPGNPLYFFETIWGSHLLGFPVIIAGVLLVLYGPLLLYKKLRKKEL